MKKIKFLQIGLGSMGKRRIGNLLHSKIPRKNIYGFDISQQRCNEINTKYKIKCFVDFEQAINIVNPDVYIISTPPNLHMKYALFAAKKQKHFFTEVDTSITNYKKLLKCLNNSFIAAPSCTFRYFYPIKKIKSLIDNDLLGKPLLFNYHMGQYLPNWHPWEDYRKVYFAQKETSAIKEMIPYELNWLQWIFDSKVNQIIGVKSKITNLEMKADDNAISIIRMKNGLIGTFIIEVISRIPIRRLLLIGDKGQVEWLWKENVIKYFNYKKQETEIIKLKAGKVLKNYIITENMYNDEIKDFLNSIKKGVKFPYSFKENYQNLNLVTKFRNI